MLEIDTISFKNALNGYIHNDTVKLGPTAYQINLNELYDFYLNECNKGTPYGKTMNDYVSDYINNEQKSVSETRVKEKDKSGELFIIYQDFIKKVIHKFNSGHQYNKVNNSFETDFGINEIGPSILKYLDALAGGQSINNSEIAEIITRFGMVNKDIRDYHYLNKEMTNILNNWGSRIISRIDQIPDQDKDSENLLNELGDILVINRNYHNASITQHIYKGVRVKEEFIQFLPAIQKEMFNRKFMGKCHPESFIRLLAGMGSFEPITFYYDTRTKNYLTQFIKTLYGYTKWKAICSFFVDINGEPFDYKQVKGAWSENPKKNAKRPRKQNTTIKDLLNQIISQSSE